MTKEDAILNACIFMLDHGEEPERDFHEPEAVLCLRANVEEGFGIDCYGQDAAVLRALGKQENRATWRVRFWDNHNWLPPGTTVIQGPLDVWVDDATGEAWWVEDGQPSPTSWRK